MEVSSNGSHWFFAGAQNIVMNSCIEVGLVVTNYNSNSTVTCTFANVSVTGSMLLPPGNDSDPTLLVNYDNQQGLRDVKVYPNPTSGELNINLTEYNGKNVQIEFYSLEGKMVQLIKLDEIIKSTQTIILDGYSSGMYFMKLKSAGLPDVTKRIVLTKG